jgi:hypothetical protein
MFETRRQIIIMVATGETVKDSRRKKNIAEFREDSTAGGKK